MSKELTRVIPQREILWAVGSVCALKRLPYEAELVARAFPPPCDTATLVRAARSLGLRTREIVLRPDGLKRLVLPLIVRLRSNATPGQVGACMPEPGDPSPCLGIVTSIDAGRIVLFQAGKDTPDELDAAEFRLRVTGQAWLMAAAASAAADPDACAETARFGFRWFVPELLKHRQVWRDVLLASATLQLIALATPLFTQVIIDKVLVHRTSSTLIAIGMAMLIFLLFSGLLNWARQYLVLHTGNRVDAVLSAAVWEHLLRLPLRYFHHRSTGVVAARLHGVETIREFVAGAAVSLVLDLPFLVICLAVMLWYSVLLTAIALGILCVIAAASLFFAPLFQARLNEQFLLGARNQAFITEHIAGFETVKSLQMEPQLNQRYAGYLASYLHSSFKTKHIGNTYNVLATTLEQAMTLLILMVGAWTVMNETSFTIGMLVAFQMFAGKLSQPVLRIVGLWSQFQQVKLSVDRLGDVMNAPTEPYSLAPRRQQAGDGRIELDGISFRYADDRPMLYENLSFCVEPGKVAVIVGASGAGKSTLTKLMLGFFMPSAGRICVDGIDTRKLSANELRATFGVVPQETILFTGTVWANLSAANPAASFEQVVNVCRMAGIHQVIEALPEGYQTEIGERGAGLSGGQKQRMAIARALLKRPRVLVFDEATSSLDEPTAEAFATTINGLRGKVTIIVITHRVPKSLRVDQVLKLGKAGSHELHPVAQPNEGTTGSKQYASQP